MKISTEKYFYGVFSSSAIRGVLGKYRKKLGIPSAAFSESEEVESWIKATYPKRSDKKILLETLHNYFDDMKRRTGSRFDFSGSKDLFYRVLVLNKPDYGIGLPLGYKLLILHDHKQVPPGIYIKIDRLAKLTDIRKFISRYSKEITDAQGDLKVRTSLKYLIESPNLNERKKYLIYVINELTPQQIIDVWGLDQKYEYKEQLISRAMKEEGFQVSSDNIKKIIFRIRKEKLV